MKEWLAHTAQISCTTLSRGLYKLLVAPLKYGRGSDYDAARYWRDRFRKYGPTLQSVGDEGLDHEANTRMYDDAGRQVLGICRDACVDLGAARILDIGCGNGYFAELFRRNGARNYVGLDITDEFLPHLRQHFPDFRFVNADITAGVPVGTFDLVVFIDVIEHIVTRDKLRAALANIKASTRSGTVVLVSPVVARGWRSLFYVRFWGVQDVLREFDGFDVVDERPFRYSNLLVLRRR